MILFFSNDSNTDDHIQPNDAIERNCRTECEYLLQHNWTSPNSSNLACRESPSSPTVCLYNMPSIVCDHKLSNIFFILRSVLIQGNYLRFTSITHDDAGRYVCVASNEYGTANKSAEVIVGRNRVTGSTETGSSEYDVDEGHDVLLNCTSSRFTTGYHVSYKISHRL